MSEEQSLAAVLVQLRTQIESLAALPTEQIQKEQLIDTYRAELTPYLLELRKKQRLEMDSLEARHDKLRLLNKELVNLQEKCDCVIYEASCLGSEEEEVKPKACGSDSPVKNGYDSFQPEAIEKLDHETRMRLLDEEETRRKNLVDKMNQLNDETNKIALLNADCASQINEVKPYVKQLLDKVTPTLISRGH